MARRMGNALSVVLAVVFALAGVRAQAESHVRIIRLSYVDGSVEIDRANGQGLERAILNMPITEGVRLVTGNDGLAEVEFENNSTVRVGENSEVLFSKLLVNDAGDKVNDVELVKGTVYFDTKSGKDEIYRATVGDSAFLVHRDTQLRLSDDSGSPRLAVMKGEVQLENQPREVKVSKKETLTVDPNSAAGYDIAKGVDAAPLDQWNNERASYQTAYSYNNVGYGPNLNGYGYSDLSYYGGWSYLPGAGYGWQPYGVSAWAGWNPYLAGAWSFCPGFGYMWASAYPWGWLPYHYGAWSFVNGGWFWFPGAWRGYRNGGWYANGFQPAPVVHGPNGWRPPARPVLPPKTAYAPTVRVGTIGNLPATIPGGRVPPNFRSVVPAYRATDRAAYVPRPGPQGYGSTGAFQGNRGGNTRSMYGPYAGHVYAPSQIARPSVTPKAGGGHVYATPTRPYVPSTARGSWSGGYGPAMGSRPSMGPPAGSFHSMGGFGGGGRPSGAGASHAARGGPSPK
jgi:hypothetical protein